MKKQYIKPSMEMYSVMSETLLEESFVIYGGSNSGEGSPRSAEGKGCYFEDEDNWD